MVPFRLLRDKACLLQLNPSIRWRDGDWGGYLHFRGNAHRGFRGSSYTGQPYGDYLQEAAAAQLTAVPNIDINPLNGDAYRRNSKSAP